MNVLRHGIECYFTKEQTARIAAMRVGIAGAGGLGSNCAQMLVRSGFEQLVVADFDVVEPGNLNRQFFFPDQLGQPKVHALRDNLLRLNPDLKLDVFNGRIDAVNAREVFSGCGVIVEAFDRAECKKMLAEIFYNSGCFYVSASGLGGWGDSDALTIRRIHDRFYLVGDNVTEADTHAPPCAPRVHIAAAKQADLVLAHALGDI
jgi:sulfur carrier protein ThiS adenylyltransferase